MNASRLVYKVIILNSVSYYITDDANTKTIITPKQQITNNQTLIINPIKKIYYISLMAVNYFLNTEFVK